MKYSFSCYGHENITSKHKTTLEFTKDSKLGLEGDCIIGVKADFSLPQLKKFIKSLNNNKVTIIIKPIIKNTINNFNNENNNYKKIRNNNLNKDNNNLKINNYNGNLILENHEKINAEVNPKFNSDKEMVIRKTDFVSERTFAIRANKAAFELNNSIASFLKEKKNKIGVIVESRE